MGSFRRKSELVDLETRSPELGIKYKDLMVLGELARRGVDLSQPRNCRHYLYVSGARAASQAGDAAAAAGWDVEVREPVDEASDQWLVLCQREAVLTAEHVIATSDFFEALAAEHAGEHDGWEAAV